MSTPRPQTRKGDVRSVEFADPPTPDTRTGPLGRIPETDERVAIQLHGHGFRYVVRVSMVKNRDPRLTELSIIADEGSNVDYAAVRAVPVRRLAYTAAQWIARAGGQVGFVGDTTETHSQPENHDPRIYKAVQSAERALAVGKPVRPTVAAELNVSTKTVDRLLKRAKAEGWHTDTPLPKTPQPRQRDTTAD